MKQLAVYTFDEEAFSCPQCGSRNLREEPGSNAETGVYSAYCCCRICHYEFIAEEEEA